MIAALSILTGPVGKVLGVAAIVVGLFVGGVLVMRQHDQRVLAEQRVAEQAARIATMQADAARTVAALEEQAARTAALQASISSIRSTINAAPRTTGCAASPAVRAVLDGLRKPASDRGAQAADPAVPANVRAAAGRTGVGR